MILALHTRYRTTGGEERAVQDLTWLARERLGERAELLERESTRLGRRRAAVGLVAGGLDPAEVAEQVHRTGADVVHAHNLLPAFGWRALAAAREAGAATVLHLHNYRLVCAVATCVDPAGEDCVRCRGRDTRPGLQLGCRGSRVEGALYAGALAAWQRRMVAEADVVLVPSLAAAERLAQLGAPVSDPLIVPHVVRAADGDPRGVRGGAEGGPALVVARLAPEKGIEVAIAACASAGVGLVVAGDGPEAAALRAHARGQGLALLEGLPGEGDAATGAAPGRPGAGPAPGARAGAARPAEASPLANRGEVRFTGRVDERTLVDLRAAASVELVPSRAHETFGLSAVEALAAGLPVVASAVGALKRLPAPARLVRPGDVASLAAALPLARGDVMAAREAGPRAAARLAGPDTVAPQLAAAYAAARAARRRR